MDRTGELAAAALRLVTAGGLPAVTFRSVAAESGWSLGAVQKTFPTKDALIRATLSYAQATIALQVSVDPGRPTLRAWLVELVMATLPLDDARRSACLVSVAVSDRAPFDPEVAHSLAGWDAEVRGNLARLAGRARHEGELHPEVDGENLARAVLAFAAGLAGQLLYDPVDEATVLALVQSTMAALTPGL
ncbi:TetR family transcriptional regulator C-terminal domain-containing protein [Cryobacterium sp. SO2]|uniref:TetR/AcrR family transcriptional regulator n=1 Tax=Cryobacterium sp. SO2 TaxID=1897060 RepID=UPI00223D9446|nr:TetR/AcrR family transcriptional regulator [Cryobacterium sp. SO2]WEO77447.1 TetR family transcriptional regulator C-terminal domain-containing protein [Cryobacterium sp. SO2]